MESDTMGLGITGHSMRLKTQKLCLVPRVPLSGRWGVEYFKNTNKEPFKNSLKMCIKIIYYFKKSNTQRSNINGFQTMGCFD